MKKLRVTGVRLIDGGRPVDGRRVELTCTEKELPAVRERLKVEMANEYLERLEVDLQYVELEVQE